VLLPAAITSRKEFKKGYSGFLSLAVYIGAVLCSDQFMMRHVQLVVASIVLHNAYSETHSCTLFTLSATAIPSSIALQCLLICCYV
jgi:hypothetical protein